MNDLQVEVRTRSLVAASADRAEVAQ